MQRPTQSAADRLQRLAAVTIRVVDPASDAAASTMRAYFAELEDRFPTGFTADDTVDDIAAMGPPSGGFVVVDDDGQSRGCGGLRRVDDAVAEIKRMWLHPSLRGLGLGKRVLARLEEIATDLGYGSVMLDTNAVLTEAISMYESSGYVTTERYNDNPYAQRWFRKTLC